MSTSAIIVPGAPLSPPPLDIVPWADRPTYDPGFVGDPITWPSGGGSSGGDALAPDTSLEGFSFGWDAGAFSIASLSGNLTARFGVLHSSIGAAVGISSSPAGEGFDKMSHAIVVANRKVHLCESGVVADSPVAANAAGDEYRIVRVGTTVTYWRNEELLGISSTPSSGEVWMDASLFAAGDTIIAPSLEAFAGAVMSSMMHPVGEVLGFSGGANLSLQALSTQQPQGGRGRLNAMTLLASNYRTGRADLCLQPLWLNAHTWAANPDWAISTSYIFPPVIAAHGLTGTVGRADLQLSALDALGSDRPYADGRPRMRAMVVRGFDAPADIVYVVESMLLYSGSMAEASIVVLMNEHMTAGCVVLVQGLVGASAISAAEVETVAQLAGEVLGTALDAFFVSSIASPRGGPDESSAWAVNVETSASARYERYGFNSFAVIAGVAYGAKDGGVFRLDGEDDDGEPIVASVHFGTQDFGTTNLKSVPSVYVGACGDGNVFLRVGDGKYSYLYKVRRSDERMGGQRFDLGRGLRASYFDFELFNEAGADFELDTIQFEVLASKRSI